MPRLDQSRHASWSREEPLLGLVDSIRDILRARVRGFECILMNVYPRTLTSTQTVGILKLCTAIQLILRLMAPSDSARSKLEVRTCRVYVLCMCVCVCVLACYVRCSMIDADCCFMHVHDICTTYEAAATLAAMHDETMCGSTDTIRYQ
jgi:hypothetical protein